SADSGGDLGEIERGVMVQPFEAALFSMQVDQLSEPVKTAFGWHLIKLRSISGGETQSFESLKASLEDEIKTELAEIQIYDLVENLANLVYEQSDSLLPAAEQLDLSVQTSDWFDRSAGEGIAVEPKIRQVAFSPEVLTQGLNSEAIELGNDRVVFLRLHQREPSIPQPLEQVRETIKTELVKIKARELSLKAGTDALAELEGGKSLDDLAREWSSTISDLGFIQRNQSGVDAAVLNRAFSMRKPDQGKVYDGLSKSSGDYVMLELSAVVSSDTVADDEALDGLVEGLGNLEYQAVLKILTSRADITRTPPEDLEDL
ncbi:MAG: peptidyl-prolyl cis-trans isomerase, partial [Gammaproteobacteria bacterium]|nr:peptidyl-prolyl cis-trans isomerase [Gammaproteobacteria bacterium]